jgi:hypothetical protein
MGPWDIMSQHFTKQGEPPPGLSSFTKIRLGWIKPHQVRIEKPGETAFAFLPPLSKGGDPLVVKIPLNDGTYYLIENRQPVGFDRTLPDSGILILRVFPRAAEGYGTVEVKNAATATNFANATYRLEANKRNIFVDRKQNIAIIPLWKENENLGVLVTNPANSEAALNAATAIQALISRSTPAPDSGKESGLREAMEAFKNKDFAKSLEIARGLGGR